MKTRKTWITALLAVAPLAAQAALYDLLPALLAADDPDLMTDWRRLSTSDHLYYMCTKWFSDGDVHKYFSPYNDPHDAFIAFMNVLDDLSRRAGQPLSTIAVS